MKTGIVKRKELPFLPGEDLEIGELFSMNGKKYQIVNLYDSGWIVEIERVAGNEL